MDSTSEDERTHTGFETFDFFRSFAQTVRGVILEPARFFRDLDRRRPSGSAVIFAVVCGVMNILLLQLVAPVDSWIWGETYPAADRAYWIILALSPLLVWAGVYLLAALQHFLVMIFVRPREDYDATLLVYAYATALALLSWIPVVGYLASAYGLFVTMLGIRGLHDTTTTRAFLSILMPLLILLASTAWSLWP